MAKTSKPGRQSPRNPREPDDSLKILNLGECFDLACSHYDPKYPHYHGLAYTKKQSTPELISQAEKTLRAIGFEGSLEVEKISLDEWKKRAAGQSDWL